MQINPAAPVVRVGAVAPAIETEVAEAVAAPAAPAPAPARSPTGTLTWAQANVNLEKVVVHVDATVKPLSEAERNAKEARIIELEKQIAAQPNTAKGERYKLQMERDLLKSELADTTMPAPARAKFLAQVNLTAQYKDLQWSMANAKNPVEVNSFWSLISALAPKVKNINPEDILGVKTVANFNRVLDLWGAMPTASKADGYRGSMEIRLLQQEDMSGKFSVPARQAYMAAVEVQAQYQDLQKRWLDEKDPAKASALWQQVGALRPKARTVHAEDLLGFKTPGSLAKAVEIQNKLPSSSEGQDYRLSMDLKLLRQEDTFGPMPVTAKLEFVKEVAANAEIRDLYAKLQGNPTRAESSTYFARLVVLQSKARYADPEQLLNLSDEATANKVASLHAQMDPTKPTECYRLSKEIALVRFENNFGSVSSANKTLFHEKVAQVSAYKGLLWQYINETDKNKAAGYLTQMNDAKKLAGSTDPDFYLIAG